MEHKLIQGGEQYLPFARSRIKALKATGLKYASQKFEIDGVSISVKLVGEEEYIEILGDVTITYEFFASGPLWNPHRNPPVGILFDQLNQDGSAVRLIGKKGSKELTALPLWSSIYPPDTEDPQWELRDRRWWAQNEVRIGGSAGSKNFITIYSHPSEHFGSYHHYYNNKESNLITSCRAFGPGACTMGPYGITGTLHLSGISISDKLSYFSFGSVPNSAVPTALGEVERRDWSSLFWKSYRHAPGFSTSYPFAWTDTRVSTAPLFWIKDQAGTVTLNPPLGADGRWYQVLVEAEKKDLYRYLFGSRLTPAVSHEDDAAYIFDIPPARYKGGGVDVGAGIAGPFLHWRHAAILVVKDVNDKNVSLFVLTDTHNGFMFYEAIGYTDEFGSLGTGDLGGAQASYNYRNLPPSEWVRVKPEMPEWVTLLDETKPHRDLSWLWRFGKDATKAVSTPINAVAAKLWTHPISEAPVLGSGWSSMRAFFSYEESRGNTGGHPLVVAELYYLAVKTAEMSAEFNVVFNQIAEARPFVSLMMNLEPAPDSVLLFAKMGNAYHLMASGAGDILSTGGQSNGPLFGFNDFLLTPGDGYRAFAEKHGAAPVMVVTPGLVEVRISAVVDYDDEGKMIISPSVSVTREDFFDVSKKVYADAAYYVKTPRAKKQSDSLNIENLPEDDDLLVADIVVTGRKYHTLGGGLAWPEIVRGIPRPAMNAFYVVRNLTAGNTALTLCLAAQANLWTTGYKEAVSAGYDGTNNGGVVPSMFFASIVAGDLRYLSFITATHYRRECAYEELRSSEPGGAAFVTTHGILPRFELRIPGEPLRAINYGHDVYSGYAGGSINLSQTTLTPDADATDFGRIYDYDLSWSEWTSYTDVTWTGTYLGTASRYSAGNYGYSPSFGADPMTGIAVDFQLGGGYAIQSVSGATQNVETQAFDDSPDSRIGYHAVRQVHYEVEVIPYPSMDENYTATLEQRKMMMQRFLPLVTPAQYQVTFSFTPTGDYAVYFDARSEQFPAPKTTPVENKVGMFDIIKIGKLYTSHAEALNQAFRRTEDPITMPVDVSESQALSGVGVFGSNGIFTYKIPQEEITTGVKFKPA